MRGDRCGAPGSRCLILESGGRDAFGGNSRYTAGAIRFAFKDQDSLKSLLVGYSDPRIESTDFGEYPVSRFASDLISLNNGKPLNALQTKLVETSYETVNWLAGNGVLFEPIYDRQSFSRRGRHRFWGGLVLGARGEGEGLIEMEWSVARVLGVELKLHQRVVSLECHDGLVSGVRTDKGEVFSAKSVVLACGGFEADEGLRVRHLGVEWGYAKVRGTPFNRGDGLTIAESVGGGRSGKFKGCHAVCVDVATPLFDRLDVSHSDRKNFRKISYPFGIMLNSKGKRFVDEGADFRNYTYAQYGREVLLQPGNFVWHVFDGQVLEFLYDEYRVPLATSIKDDTRDSLVAQLDGVNYSAAVSTLREYDASIKTANPFDPTRKDGRSTKGVVPPKSNWALSLSERPFQAFKVTCGITFTYGGVQIDTSGGVLDTGGQRIPGLFAAGEVVGGLFFHGYPGGSGLLSGAVFGRAAGRSASNYASQRN